MNRSPSRRTLLGTGAAVVVGVGASPTLAVAASSADAALVAAVDRALDAEQRMLALTAHLVGVPPDVQAEHDAWGAVQDEALEEALSLPAVGMDGLRAKAKLARNFIVTTPDDQLADGSYMDARTAWSLCNDLLRLAGGTA